MRLLPATLEIRAVAKKMDEFDNDVLEDAYNQFIFGKTYVNRFQGMGMESLHFNAAEDGDGGYVSYENHVYRSIKLSDGTPMPMRLYFQDFKYDPEKDYFEGYITYGDSIATERTYGNV